MYTTAVAAMASDTGKKNAKSQHQGSAQAEGEVRLDAVHHQYT